MIRTLARCITNSWVWPSRALAIPLTGAVDAVFSVQRSTQRRPCFTSRRGPWFGSQTPATKQFPQSLFRWPIYRDPFLQLIREIHCPHIEDARHALFTDFLCQGDGALTRTFAFGKFVVDPVISTSVACRHAALNSASAAFGDCGCSRAYCSYKADSFVGQSAIPSQPWQTLLSSRS